MAENEFMIKLLAMLDKTGSKKQINSDIKELEKVIKKLRMTQLWRRMNQKRI